MAYYLLFFRMYPVVIGNGRCMTKDTVIKGYHIPKGVSVKINTIPSDLTQSQQLSNLPLCFIYKIHHFIILNYFKQVQVVFQHCVISNQEKYFPRCSEFLPERWLEECDSRHAFASLPFGYGRRMCLGRRFADLELVMVISKACIFI